ncbi:MAG: hypothetical protein E7070_09400 [Bacteroidales bacterium]|nr:hypothetical protein [Bacteroidales bacterium]
MDWLFIVFSVGKHTILPRIYVVTNAILLIFPDLHRPPENVMSDWQENIRALPEGSMNLL